MQLSIGMHWSFFKSNGITLPQKKSKRKGERDVSVVSETKIMIWQVMERGNCGKASQKNHVCNNHESKKISACKINTEMQGNKLTYIMKAQ